MSARLLLATTLTLAHLTAHAQTAHAQTPTTQTPAPPQAQTPVTVLPSENNIPRHAPALTLVPMTFADQGRFYLRNSFNTPSLLLPALPAAIVMAAPPSHYPRSWKDGGGAFGRNFGDALAAETAANTGKFLAGSLLHEDPRYFPDTSRNVPHRIVHALAFTLVDTSTHGKRRPALSNFAGAAAGGFIGRLYLPPGFSDNTHALQRTSGIFVGYAPTQLVGYATGNLVLEFTPDLKTLGRKLHLPFTR